MATGMLLYYPDNIDLFDVFSGIMLPAEATFDECVFSLSSELGAAGAVETKVGRGGSDSARLPAAAAVAIAAARPRRHRNGAPARADFHRACRQRYAFLKVLSPKYSRRDYVSW